MEIFYFLSLLVSAQDDALKYSTSLNILLALRKPALSESLREFFWLMFDMFNSFIKQIHNDLNFQFEN